MHIQTYVVIIENCKLARRTSYLLYNQNDFKYSDIIRLNYEKHIY